MKHTFSKPSAAVAIDQHLDGRDRRALVSLADAVAAVRRDVPGCEHSDGELATLAALQAMSRGFLNLSFDIGAEHAFRPVPG